MWGTGRPGAGVSASTVPGTQPNPSCVPCSKPLRRHQLHADADAQEGTARVDDRRSSASAIPSKRQHPARQSAKAPTPGSTIRSASRTASGDALTTMVSPPFLTRGALERLGRRAQIPGPVIDNAGGHSGAAVARQQHARRGDLVSDERTRARHRPSAARHHADFAPAAPRLGPAPQVVALERHDQRTTTSMTLPVKRREPSGLNRGRYRNEKHEDD